CLIVQLLHMLDDLGQGEVERFQFHLQYQPGGDFPRIYKCQLENADRLKTVDVMVQTYSDHVMEVARLILKKMNAGQQVFIFNLLRPELFHDMHFLFLFDIWTY
uniref:Pyrin domain-containing protein n=1 Tax=Pundamilia nyererei TaxID=303518 RepID=A0A3B4H950_9CICH